MPRASDPANQSELYRHLRRAGYSIALAVERDGEELTREVGLIPVEPVLARAGLMIAGVLFAPASVDVARAERPRVRSCRLREVGPLAG